MFEVKQDEVPALKLSHSELDLISRMVEAGWVMKMRPRAVETLVEQLLGHIAALGDDSYHLANEQFDNDYLKDYVQKLESRGTELEKESTTWKNFAQARRDEANQLIDQLEQERSHSEKLATLILELHSVVPGHPVYESSEQAVRLVQGYVFGLQSRVAELEQRECCKCGHSKQRHLPPVSKEGNCYLVYCNCVKFKPES